MSDDDTDLENASDADHAAAEPKADGLGENGTIPADPGGVAAGFTAEKSNFEPEEDEDAPA